MLRKPRGTRRERDMRIQPRALWVAGLLVAAGHLHAASHDAPPHDVHVGILMFDGVQIIDFAGPFEVFGQAGFKVSTVSTDGKPITTHMGLKVTPDFSLATAPALDIVLVPGGHVHDVMKEPAVQAWLKARAQDTDHLLSVCTGSHILATSGLLAGLPATTFHRAFDELAELSPTTRVLRDVRWVDNGRVLTSAGLSSGIDAALHLVERIRGRDRARTLAMHLEYDWRPEEGFVRGLMADRYLPRTHVEWPADMKFERLAAYGDHAEWLERYRIRSGAAPAEFLAAVRRAHAEGTGWTTKSATSSELRLEGRPAPSVAATLIVTVSPRAADGSFELAMRLQLRE
jgi:putative intracellular protease/amidase